LLLVYRVCPPSRRRVGDGDVAVGMTVGMTGDGIAETIVMTIAGIAETIAMNAEKRRRAIVTDWTGE